MIQNYTDGVLRWSSYLVCAEEILDETVSAEKKLLAQRPKPNDMCDCACECL